MTHSAHRYRSTAPGALSETRCDVCGAPCTITRSLCGPRNLAEAMAGLNVEHDRVDCPYDHTDWHRDASALGRLAADNRAIRVLLNRVEALESAAEQTH